MAIDWSILDGIQNVMRCPFLDWLMPIITFLGNSGLIWIILGCCLLITKKYRKTGVFILVGLLMSLLIGNLWLKNLIARPRSCWQIDSWSALIAMPKDFSFPSGHTYASFIAVTILMFENRKLAIPAFVLALLIAFSRLYLYVHFPSDILGGIIMGVAIGVFVEIVGNRVARLIQSKRQ